MRSRPGGIAIGSDALDLEPHDRCDPVGFRSRAERKMLLHEEPSRDLRAFYFYVRVRQSKIQGVI
jgi:hypothetical protein